MKSNPYYHNDKIFTVDLDSKLNNRISLHYIIFKNRVSTKWLMLLEESIERNKEITCNFRKKYTPAERQELFNKFVDAISIINENYDIVLPTVDSLETLNNNILNLLHQYFEEYGERVDFLVKENKFNQLTHDNFLLLNNLIHSFQASTNLRLCTADFIPYLQEKINLVDEDYFLFTSDRSWGSLYLGYNTLGKHWIGLAADNELVNIESRIRVQKQFSTEFMLDFNKGQLPHGRRMQFYEWWTRNNLSEKFNPGMTLAEFAFGNLPLGYFVGYTENNNFKSVDEFTEREFNENVWDKCISISNIKIEDKSTFNPQAGLKIIHHLKNNR
jgi:hypothetical protein